MPDQTYRNLQSLKSVQNEKTCLVTEARGLKFSLGIANVYIVQITCFVEGR